LVAKFYPSDADYALGIITGYWLVVIYGFVDSGFSNLLGGEIKSY